VDNLSHIAPFQGLHNFTIHLLKKPAVTTLASLACIFKGEK
jgi:hypothetical protein